MGDIKVLVLPQLVPMLIILVSVFILFMILKKFLHKPVTEFIQKRQENIETDIEDAKILKQEAIDLKAEYEDRIEKAKLEGQEIVESSRVRGTELEKTMLEDAKKESEKILERARIQIAREKEKAYDDVKKSAGEMAILIATKIMEKDIDLENQNILIDKFIDEVGSSKWQN
ncbi:MAG: F0F1 ATP synthase subunit B [Tissierella sp.]|uniref:F0F1 ATP synthase subunit B n=1 Tax=Tissierella sp. TaxID=41274 RepID=UPI003F986484